MNSLLAIGNHLDFQYSDEDRLALVHVNSTARYVKFNYDDEGRLSSLEDHSGRIIRYSYDDWGQLASVVGPQAHGQLPVASECYEYDTVGTRRLTRVFDYKGRLLVENEYENSTQSENFGRVIRQAERAGETMFAYERLLLPTDPTALLARDAATLRVWEYSRNGHEIEHLFNEAGNELMRRQHYVDGCAQRTKITRFRYNADGELVARLAPDGVLIQRLLFRDHLGDRIPWPEEVDVYLGDVDLFDRMSFGNVLATVTRATRLEVDTVEPSRELWETLPATKAPLTTGDEAQKQTYDQADPA